MSLSAPQAIHRPMTEALCCYLWDTVESESLDGGGTGSIRCRACVVLYLLLCDHSVDRRGRCRSCRRSGAALGQRRRKCRIHVEASFWLRQPDDVVLRHLASELNDRPARAQGTGGRPDRFGTTRAVPAIDPDASPAVRPDPDHGGVGEHPERLRSRCAPLDDHTPHTGQAKHVVLSGRRIEVAPGAHW